ncbi:bifunctional D-cysteine desulfhydrase/1-aminocyclopropane-1-carboxylate deaminase, mitochondrial [Strongylocentrotus purpuratus]|uniref:Tryptophan synthase beta chain-like PALP domain-containing protein n=1 Tax=Strongylocentrotus purpuratus TaxID=7668 RepID=A0A7M7RF14_STRPU|nr:bifunctional D-cysteine desulfhydrase/1-aminocyclopropane-1-carboxylate deaminase, mitochondrial [Strongylocentrotus purpuratus]XP_787534.1 bifunctional D-cysteine desulfhydrase/1-aminocyclopropane-1-carboxylate deaminase, mitochondrial [Strongylocentrotus purpuratus]|eukprot:XP_011664376.1 PREDICTED: bifunctional D-cysteine desulfhydrase/1-aminocyclopropane-1-carboxylate deaminase, mitochondrial [Strongylocentrotus purpuratus]
MGHVLEPNNDYPLLPYDAPEWTSRLAVIPKYRVQLGSLGTPIQRWRLPGMPEDFQVHIKRDDMTGSVLSGNKVRKLEFLMADCLDQGCESIITCGGVFSNSCRAGAIAARQMGLDSHLFLWSESTDLPFTGNALLDRLVGCNFYLMPLDCPLETQVYPRMKLLQDHIQKTTNKKAYRLPFGGSNEVGVWGYIECFRELMGQGLLDRFTDIVIAAGSSGSVTGLAIANYLTGSKLKIHGFAACKDQMFFYDLGDKTLQSLGLQDADGAGVKAVDIMHIRDEVVGIGYAVNTSEELECIEQVAMNTGILVDPVYSGKATYHLLKLMNEKPGTFKGKQILFIHTGGVFDLFSGAVGSRLTKKGHKENKVYDWMDLSDKVPDKVSAAS